MKYEEDKSVKMEGNIKIIQCNIQSLRKHKEELQRVLIGEEYSVALLQETWTQELHENSSRYRISGFIAFSIRGKMAMVEQRFTSKIR